MHQRALAYLSVAPLLALFGIPLFGLASCGSSPADPTATGDAGVINPGGVDVGDPCTSNAACKSNSCVENKCAAAAVTPPDNRTGCTKDEECPSSACGDDGKCASAPSCTRAHGGRTCGPSGNEDCCTVVTQGKFQVDKYLITAGRMRAFILKVQGDVQSFVGSLPAEQWKAEWSETDSLPFDADSADELLGPYADKKSCNNGQYTGHSYWTPKTDADYSDFDQNTLDEKALNCTPWPMMQALCAFDGGHIATLEELRAGFTNNGTTKYPWGDDGLDSVSAPDPEERLNMEGAFATSPLPATFRKDNNGNPYEASFRISPPGRYPKGNNQAGMADSAGDLLEWTGDRLRQFVWKADFEHHASNAAGFNGGNWWWESTLGQPWVWGTGQLFGNAGSAAEKNGYYAIGARCAH